MFMNTQTLEILKLLNQSGPVNQRKLAALSGFSLGAVNKALKTLAQAGMIDENNRLTDNAMQYIRERSPHNAIILAAGFGMRMVPISQSVPKAFLEVKGERLIERLIRQLREAGIHDISVVVGFMKDSFEYLIDDFGVSLIVNEEYASRNNLHSLALAANRISGTYIVPCDIWCAKNPFTDTELYSWYLVSDRQNRESTVRVNRKNELVSVDEDEDGSRMIGISYICADDAENICTRLRELDQNRLYEQSFWEAALYQKDRMCIRAKICADEDMVEINTYEQLRDFDASSDQLHSDAISTIAETFNVAPEEISGITVLKKGMTNRSFLFTVNHCKYIMRIPGEGTDQLISRRNEAAVYQAISGKGLCDDPVYINPENGYKITKYLNNVRVCDSTDVNDLKICMKRLRSFHEMRLSVPHEFNIWEQIRFYETLWKGAPSVYRDYEKTKTNVFSLKPFVDSLEKDRCLAHIDSVPDNFLFHHDDDQTEELQLTDWEYAGMQDPHVDIAMFIIYSLYSKDEADRLIDIYFEGQCDQKTRAKIYCYIAMCGLLWSNWCEFKRQLGVEFGEYSLRQYRFAKDYFRYASNLIGELNQ